MTTWMSSGEILLKRIAGALPFAEQKALLDDLRLSGICPAESMIPGQLCFYDGPDLSEVLTLAETTPLGALVISETTKLPETAPSIVLICAKSPLQALLKLVSNQCPEQGNISSLAVVSPTAQIGEGSTVGAFCVVGPQVSIGKNTTLHPRVVLYEGASVGDECTLHAGAIVREHCKIGDRAIIQNGCVVGADGFGYYPLPGKGLQPVPQIGIVNVGEETFLGANSCIDRGTFGSTEIGAKSKLGSLVQIGHNNILGENCRVESQVGLAGSSHIGADTFIGQGAKIRDHLTIADGVQITAGSLVYTNLVERNSYSGEGPYTTEEWQGIQAALKELPQASTKK